LGIKTLAVTSDGVFYENPKTLYKAEKRLKRLDRRLSRKQKGSKNREKAKLIRAKAYQKVAASEITFLMRLQRNWRNPSKFWC